MEAPQSVDSRAVSLDQLLDRVESSREAVRIVRDGRAAAEVKPLNEGDVVWQLRGVVEALKPRISSGDALAPLDEDDWPTEARP